jgi:flap endonuclease-1
MGIKSIRKILTKKCSSDAIYKTNISQFANTIIFVDVSIFMYKFKYIGDINSNFTKMITKLLFYNITPIFVFDGKPSNKDKVLEERKVKKEKLKIKINNLHNELQKEADRSGIILVSELPVHLQPVEPSDSMKELIVKIQKTEKQNISITWKDYQDIKTLLITMGIKFIHAPYETDIVIPYIIKQKNINIPLCLSDDTDFLAHNINLLSKFDVRSGNIEYFNIKKIKEQMNMNKEEFVDMCVLMGCDYCSSIKGVGPMTAFKIIKQCKNLETYFKKTGKKDVNEFYNARNMFINPEIEYDVDFELENDKINFTEFENISKELNINEHAKKFVGKIKTKNPITNYFKFKSK